MSMSDRVVEQMLMSSQAGHFPSFISCWFCCSFTERWRPWDGTKVTASSPAPAQCSLADMLGDEPNSTQTDVIFIGTHAKAYKRYVRPVRLRNWCLPQTSTHFTAHKYPKNNLFKTWWKCYQFILDSQNFFHHCKLNFLCKTSKI